MRLIACQPAGWREVVSKPGGKSVEKTLENVISRLQKISDIPHLDAQVLVAYLLDKPRSWVLAHPEAQIPKIKSATLNELVARLEAGDLLPYVLGVWEFFGLEFITTPEVLIPRPETELLVERAISWLSKSRLGSRENTVLDVGTGSGCIAISLAVNIPDITITATDISYSALEVAYRNAEKMAVSGRIKFLEADLVSHPGISDPFSLIVTNPPYIPTHILQKIPIYGHEPTLALDGGSDGLVIIRRILAEVSRKLIPGGLFLMEIEASEGQDVLSLAAHAFPRGRIHLHKDLAGHDRVLEVQT
jgi:release factor glutamine methyltransferase